MPLDPERIAETRQWLDRSRADLRAAEADLSVAPPLLEDTLFHCQQAAEKALKAFLTWHDRPFRKTHDLVELGRLCIECDGSLEPTLRRGAALTEYAWAYRYPGDYEPPTREEVDRELAVAREVYAVVTSLLPGEVKP